jgi:hypothetical protein
VPTLLKPPNPRGEREIGVRHVEAARSNDDAEKGAEPRPEDQRDEHAEPDEAESEPASPMAQHREGRFGRVIIHSGRIGTPESPL